MAAKKQTSKVRAAKAAAPPAPVDELSALLDAMGPVDTSAWANGADVFADAIAIGERLIETLQSHVDVLKRATIVRANKSDPIEAPRLQRRADTIQAAWLAVLQKKDPGKVPAYYFIAAAEWAHRLGRDASYARELYAHRYPKAAARISDVEYTRAVEAFAAKRSKWKPLLSIVERHFAKFASAESLKNQYSTSGVAPKF
jgi:hypothetical protein